MMDDAGFILTCYAVTFGAIAAYAAYVLRRGRRATAQLPDEVKPWT
jgi:heme exporter protein CcmD